MGGTRNQWRYSPRCAAPHQRVVAAAEHNEPRKEYVSFWNHDAAMSESNDSRVEARECLRKANRGNDKLNRWAWLVLAQTWLLLAKTQEIAENSVEAN